MEYKQRIVDRAARLLMVLPFEKTDFICMFIFKVAEKMGNKRGVDYFTKAGVDRGDCM